MTIANASLEDAERLSQIALSLSRFYCDDGTILPGWFNQTLTVNAFEQRLCDTNFSHFLYLIDEKITGFIAIKDSQTLYHLFVDENYHRQGIAKELWQYVTFQFDSSTFSLRSSLYAVPVYKLLGFTESGPLQSKDGLRFQPMRWHRES